MRSSQSLSEHERRTVARWAAACAEHVLPLFRADPASEAVLRDGLSRVRAYSLGAGDTADEIRRRFGGGAQARAADSAAGAAAARSVGQAIAVAHMGAHALGAAAYAARASALAHPDDPRALEAAVRSQLDDLTPAERAALRTLPPLGADRSGPLGPGLLARGDLGTAIRALQADIGARTVGDG